MSSKAPVFRQISWFSLVPHLIVLGGLIWLFELAGVKEAAIYGVSSYMLLSISLRWLVAKDHRKGMSDVKRGEFAQAIPSFERSHTYFSKHKWVDEYRYLTLLSSSKLNYREMALVNIAFCYGQLGEAGKAMAYYEMTLQEFPESVMASTGLRMLQSVKNN